MLFRVTRNADVEVEEDRDEDLLQALERELARRRFGPAVRLEITETMDPQILDVLISKAFSLAGTARFEPFAGWDFLFIDAPIAYGPWTFTAPTSSGTAGAVQTVSASTNAITLTANYSSCPTGPVIANGVLRTIATMIEDQR